MDFFHERGKGKFHAGNGRKGHGQRIFDHLYPQQKYMACGRVPDVHHGLQCGFNFSSAYYFNVQRIFRNSSRKFDDSFNDRKSGWLFTRNCYYHKNRQNEALPDLFDYPVRYLRCICVEAWNRRYYYHFGSDRICIWHSDANFYDFSISASGNRSKICRKRRGLYNNTGTNRGCRNPYIYHHANQCRRLYYLFFLCWRRYAPYGCYRPVSS